MGIPEPDPDREYLVQFKSDLMRAFDESRSQQVMELIKQGTRDQLLACQLLVDPSDGKTKFTVKFTQQIDVHEEVSPDMWILQG